MKWLDIDRNGRVDGRDFYILNEIIGFDDEEKQEEDDVFSYSSCEDSDDSDLW